MMKRTGARGWTEDELIERVHDSVFAGANAFYAGRYGGGLYDHLRELDLLTVTDARPNQHFGEYPEEWRAGKLEGWEGKQWVCPSIPEARAALIKQWREDFAKRPKHDVMRFYSGDPGGCRDERCMPWGDTFIHLCDEIGRMWKEMQPESIVLVANQDLTNAGDQAIFDFLNTEPRDWLYGLCYSPGTNAMSDYFRDELREDLFEYPRHGPTNRYLALTYHALPPQQEIVHFSDITHWISAQYEVESPDRALMKCYGRRTFHARPRAMYRIFQLIMPFSEGDIIYSEGHHDEFHQYLWARLLWDPSRALEDVMEEYCRLYFGEDATPLMVEALYQLEDNLETSFAENKGVQRYYDLVVEAGAKMPAHLMENDYRWRLHMQKAVLDRYNQLKLQQEVEVQERVREALLAGIESGRLLQAASAAQDALAGYRETEAMAALREEAKRLGDESEARFGVRNIGYSRIEDPIRDMKSLGDALQRIVDAQRSEREALAHKAVEITERNIRLGIIFW